MSIVGKQKPPKRTTTVSITLLVVLTFGVLSFAGDFNFVDFPGALKPWFSQFGLLVQLVAAMIGLTDALWAKHTNGQINRLTSDLRELDGEFEGLVGKKLEPAEKHTRLMSIGERRRALNAELSEWQFAKDDQSFYAAYALVLFSAATLLQLAGVSWD